VKRKKFQNSQDACKSEFSIMQEKSRVHKEDMTLRMDGAHAAPDGDIHSKDYAFIGYLIF
jgi:hypothetical protein